MIEFKQNFNPPTIVVLYAVSSSSLAVRFATSLAGTCCDVLTAPMPTACSWPVLSADRQLVQIRMRWRQRVCAAPSIPQRQRRLASYTTAKTASRSGITSSPSPSSTKADGIRTKQRRAKLDRGPSPPSHSSWYSLQVGVADSCDRTRVYLSTHARTLPPQHMLMSSHPCASLWQSRSHSQPHL